MEVNDLVRFKNENLEPFVGYIHTLFYHEGYGQDNKCKVRQYAIVKYVHPYFSFLLSELLESCYLTTIGKVKFKKNIN